MIKFLFKGLLRDRSRSLFPVLIVSSGVMLTVVLHAYVTGVMGDIIRASANFTTGHVKIMTEAYAKERDQIPNDLALDGVEDLLVSLRAEFPQMNWANRIKFGGLLDIPDSQGETKSQGPIMGMGIDLLSENSRDIYRMGIRKALRRGRLPIQQGEILLSEEFAVKLGVNPGDQATFIGSTMYGSVTFYNFTIAGTVVFGMSAMDRGAMIADITDVQRALDMEDSGGEILGYFNNKLYDVQAAAHVVQRFQEKFGKPKDEFDPVILSLQEQDGLGEYLEIARYFTSIMAIMFITAMSLVLWNAGLIGGLRRYGEVGVRLAMGEAKGHVYGSMVLESLLTGVIGSIIGTGAGLVIAWCLQKYGLNFGAFTKNAAMMISNTVYARITGTTYYIGMIPGLFSTVLGAMLAGIGIFKRQTAMLFKELEV